MDIDELRSSENVEDRRGSFGGYGRHIAIGGGGLGSVALVVIYLFLGGDPSQLLDTGSGPGLESNAGAGGGTDNEAFEFSRKIIGSAEDVWTPLMEAKGARFTPAIFTVYDAATPTGCGTGQSSAGPFYCPNDHHIYIDLSFFNELTQRFGAPGDFARAYVIAHEYGHHIQYLLGTMDRQATQQEGANGGSVRTELQADCYAGVWAFHANKQFHILQTGDVDEGIKAAEAVGDDTLEKEQQGYVVPDSFTHGTSEQRSRWFRRGLAAGDMASCDTFGATGL